jgi:hypothetical protein
MERFIRKVLVQFLREQYNLGAIDNQSIAVRRNNLE